MHPAGLGFPFAGFLRRLISYQFRSPCWSPSLLFCSCVIGLSPRSFWLLGLILLSLDSSRSFAVRGAFFLDIDSLHVPSFFAGILRFGHRANCIVGLD